MQQIDVLRNDCQHWNAKKTFDVVHGLYAGIEIFDEEGEPDSDDEADQSAEREIQSNSRTRRITWRFGNLFYADREARHGHFHRLALRTGAHAIEQRLFLDVRVFRSGIVGAQIFGLELLSVDLLQALAQFVARGLRAF